MNEEPDRRTIVLEMIDEYYERVLCFVRRSLPGGEADDVVQETFLRILRLKELRRGSISISYLIKVADNLIKGDYLRRRRFRRYLDQAHPVRRNGQGASDHRSPRADDLDRRLRSLTERERDTLRLIVCEDLSYEEAAHCLGVPVSTVNNWKHRGLRKLRRELGAAEADDRHGRNATRRSGAGGVSPWGNGAVSVRAAG